MASCSFRLSTCTSATPLLVMACQGSLLIHRDSPVNQAVPKLVRGGIQLAYGVQVFRSSRSCTSWPLLARVTLAAMQYRPRRLVGT